MSELCFPCLTLSAPELAMVVENTNTVDCCWMKLVPASDLGITGVPGPPGKLLGVCAAPPAPAGDFLLSLPTECGPPFSSLMAPVG